MSLRTLLQLSMSYLLVLALVAFGVPLVLNLRQRVDAEVRFQARSSTDVLALSAATAMAARDRAALDDLATTGARAVRGRVIVVDDRGRVAADSARPPAIGADYGSRPEIRTALSGRTVQERRASSTLDQELLVTAAPLVREGRRPGALRITQATGALDRAVGRTAIGLALVGGLVLLIGLGFAAVLARRLTRPLDDLAVAAGRVAGGDLETRAPESGSDEQRALARSFNAMTERVAELVGAHEALIADASHHLRTPLTGMRLRLEALQGNSPDEQTVRHLDAATGELDRFTRTIDELLILSDVGSPATGGDAVALAAAARRAVLRWEPTAAAREQELILARRTEGVAVRASTTDVERTLDVLLDNALRYSPPGSTVTVTIDRNAVEILDQGPGLTAQDARVVFERFRRGSAGSAGPQGTGLGLPIARELARRWGGETTLEDVPGGGLARLELPEDADLPTPTDELHP